MMEGVSIKTLSYSSCGNVRAPLLLTWVKARWRTVSEASDCRWCCRARARAWRRSGRAVEKPEDSQWSWAVASSTLWDSVKHTGNSLPSHPGVRDASNDVNSSKRNIRVSTRLRLTTYFTVRILLTLKSDHWHFCPENSDSRILVLKSDLFS